MKNNVGKVTIVGVDYSKMFSDVLLTNRYDENKDSVVGCDFAMLEQENETLTVCTTAKEVRYLVLIPMYYKDTGLIICPFDLSCLKNREISIQQLVWALKVNFENGVPHVFVVGLNVDNQKADITLSDLKSELEKKFLDAKFKGFLPLALNKNEDYENSMELQIIKNAMFNAVKQKEIIPCNETENFNDYFIKENEKNNKADSKLYKLLCCFCTCFKLPKKKENFVEIKDLNEFDDEENFINNNK